MLTPQFEERQTYTFSCDIRCTGLIISYISGKQRYLISIPLLGLEIYTIEVTWKRESDAVSHNVVWRGGGFTDG